MNTHHGSGRLRLVAAATRVTWLLAALSVGLGCDGARRVAPAASVSAQSPRIRRLDPAVAGFRAVNRQRLDAFLASHGRGSPGYRDDVRPVAVFDWDNTMMRNDIGDATMYWALLHDRIRQPPDRDWSRTQPELTPEALAALHRACDAAANPNEMLPTSRTPACAAEILAIFEDGHTTGSPPASAPAWRHETTLTSHAPYAWGAQLLWGNSPDEVRAIAQQVYAQNREAPVGATQLVAGRNVTGYVRIYEPMHDLVTSLREDGFDVWVVSASPQYVVEVVASQVGVTADHVVGIRTRLGADGKLTMDLEPCGNSGEPVITYNQGKRCWINRAIFRLPVEAQLSRAADASQRPVFAAGDSDTDLAMVQDATVLKLTIDRHRVGLMCNAFANYQNRWLVQPMFIEPLPDEAHAYSCGGVVDEAGASIANLTGGPFGTDAHPQ